jgi:hypothetical protein
MALSYIDVLRTAMLAEIGTEIDAGTGAGKLRIYDGTGGRPADADTAVTTQVLLAELTFSDPSISTNTGGVLTFDTITDDSSADATGTAVWFRVVDSDNNAVFDGDVSTSGSDLNLNSTSITSGGTVSVTSFTITEGNA